MDEVADRQAAFVQGNGLAFAQQREKDRYHAGIGVFERLARPVNIEVAQRDKRQAEGARGVVAVILLLFFAERIHRKRFRRAVGTCRNRTHRTVTMRAVHCEITGTQGGGGAQRGVKHTVFRTVEQPFAIDRSRGGEDETFQWPPGFENGFNQYGGAVYVGGNVVAEVVHALSDTGARGQMVDRVDTFQRMQAIVQAADVASGACGNARQFVRKFGMCSVDLRIQAVEQMDVVSGRMQGGGRVCSNKTGTAGNQDVHNAHRDGGQRNLALKKSYHTERVRVFIMGCFFCYFFIT